MFHKLPRDLEALIFPGYFYDRKTHHLLSLKIGGVLKPLKLGKKMIKRRDGSYSDPFMGWSISHKSQSFQISESSIDKYLKSGKSRFESTIPRRY